MVQAKRTNAQLYTSTKEHIFQPFVNKFEHILREHGLLGINWKLKKNFGDLVIRLQMVRSLVLL